MAPSSTIIVRIRCKAGTFRYEVPPESDIHDLAQLFAKEKGVEADLVSIKFSKTPTGPGSSVSQLHGSLKDKGIKHGDLLFAVYEAPGGEGSSSAVSDVQPTTSSATTIPRPWELAKEDPVDIYWRKQDGKIKRGHDSRFCKHGPHAMCDYCMPLEPFDQQYHASHSIKHLSYHAYLRKLSPSKPAISSASSLLPPLEPLSYKVKTPCPNGKHPPWPAGICSACQPSAITLQPQPFRMVDHLEFSSMDTVDRFLQAWRLTGTQRFGWLIGHYEPYNEVPMGVKAVVEAIHEPPQEGELDGLTLGLPWEDEKSVKDLASAARPPLGIVGYIFTDLDPEEEDRTKNVCKRHPDSYFLTSLEAIFAARLQLEHPMPTRSSPTGYFGSRLVTAVATANVDGEIDISAYQVSEQACAMVDADLIEASVDPGIVRVKEEERTNDTARYVPDVFFRYKNEYGIDVKKSAKPCFPVEYLLVNVTHGFPQKPTPMFVSNKFAIENRMGMEEQKIEKVLATLAKYDAPEVTQSPEAIRKSDSKVQEIARYLSDWHLLVFLSTTQLLSEDDMRLLISAASSTTKDDSPKLFIDFFNTESWKNIMSITIAQAQSEREKAVRPSRIFDDMDDNEVPRDIMEQIAAMESGNPQSQYEPMDTSDSTDGRTCPHCTFLNPRSASDCDVCGLPLAG